MNFLISGDKCAWHTIYRAALYVPKGPKTIIVILMGCFVDWLVVYIAFEKYIDIVTDAIGIED